MGPSLIGDGNSPPRSRCLRTPRRFNGAVPDWRRKLSKNGQSIRACLDASMGPSLIGDGNRTGYLYVGDVSEASMGPSLIGDGNTVTVTAYVLDVNPLQWGRP